MRPLPGSLPPIIKGVTILLFDLYELIECMGGYISVQFEGDFDGDANKDGSMAAKEKGIVKHFGITLEEEEGKYDATAQQ
ncbi:hypothetical protein Tco_0592143, partial [Tanacetum coccineum]